MIYVNGKTGPRTVPLINSIPYVKDWLNNHPQPGNPDAFLIPSLSRPAFCKKMKENSLNRIYNRYRTRFFPRLIDDEKHSDASTSVLFSSFYRHDLIYRSYCITNNKLFNDISRI